jgi:hypothetical protein
MVAGVTLSIAACSSSGTSSSASSTGGAANGAATTGASAAGGSSVQQQAAAALAPWLTRPTAPPDWATKLPRKPPTGKTIAFITCGAQAQCQSYTPFIQQAADALGWKLKVYQGGFAPQTITNVMNQVVTDKPAGVITIAMPKALAASQLKTLQSDNIPFIDIYASDPPGDGITGVVNGSVQFIQNEGKVDADWLVAIGGSSAHALFLTSKDAPVLSEVTTGFSNELSRVCTACGWKELDVAQSDVGSSSIPTRVIGFLKANPTYKYLVVSSADYATGVPAALQVAGLTDISMATSGLSQQASADVQSGTNAWKAGIVTPQEIGVPAVDMLVRAMMKLPFPASATYPEFWATQATIPAGSVVLANAVSLYKTVWGV